MMQEIADSADPRIAAYRDVGNAAALERAGLFVAEGRLVVERLLQDRRLAVHSIAVTPAAAAALAGMLTVRADVRVLVCAPDVLRAITGFDFHRGCLGLGHRPVRPPSLEDLSSARRLLALEAITDPDNVGGLFRAAFALGVGGVLLDEATADPFYRKAIRTSMAATLRLPFVRGASWRDGLQRLRDRGVRVAALTPRPDAAALPDCGLALDERMALLVGSEGSGLTDESMRLADVRIRIPVDPRADSLNVVQAAAIALYALTPRC